MSELQRPQSAPEKPPKQGADPGGIQVQKVTKGIDPGTIHTTRITEAEPRRK